MKYRNMQEGAHFAKWVIAQVRMRNFTQKLAISMV